MRNDYRDWRKENMKNATQGEHHSSRLPAPLLQLATATSLYRVQIAGNALSPRYRDGDIVIIHPAMNAEPESIPAGRAVLVALATPEMPDYYQKTGIFLLNGDGDITAGETAIERGRYIILGVVQE
jgi:hypothetical protein